MARKKATAKPARRKPGTGAIRYKTGRALPWEAAFPLGDGQYRYDYFHERSEADAHLDRLTEERDHKDMPRNIARGSQRVDTFLQFWLKIKKPHLAPKTYHDYHYQCELAAGRIGGYRLDEVVRETADNLIAFFHERGYKNVGQMKMVLRQAFDYALEEEYIRRNPFQKVKVPAVERRKTVVLSAAERQRLLDVLADRPLEPLFHLYSRLGLREGEGLALQWKDVNWSESTVTIERQYVTVRGKTVLRHNPKNKKPRVIPIPRDILEMLRRHSDRQRQQIAQTEDWEDHGLIFPSERGTPISQRNLMRIFKDSNNSLIKQARLPEDLTIHGLRHTAAYLMEQDRVPRSVRKSILGHATAAMADHYSDHADMEAMRAAVEKRA